jgi:hypothetical protein
VEASASLFAIPDERAASLAPSSLKAAGEVARVAEAIGRSPELPDVARAIVARLMDRTWRAFRAGELFAELLDARPELAGLGALYAPFQRYGLVHEGTVARLSRLWGTDVEHGLPPHTRTTAPLPSPAQPARGQQPARRPSHLTPARASDPAFEPSRLTPARAPHPPVRPSRLPPARASEPRIRIADDAAFVLALSLLDARRALGVPAGEGRAAGLLARTLLGRCHPGPADAAFVSSVAHAALFATDCGARPHAVPADARAHLRARGPAWLGECRDRGDLDAWAELVIALACVGEEAVAGDAEAVLRGAQRADGSLPGHPPHAYHATLTAALASFAVTTGLRRTK